ncbi:MAG: translation initiation factor IF-2 [Planctomycetota bacterium]
MRLSELAKELNAESKRLLAIAKELGGLGIKTASSNVEKGTESILRAAWREELEELAAKAAKKAAKQKAADAEAAAALVPPEQPAAPASITEAVPAQGPAEGVADAPTAPVLDAPPVHAAASGAATSAPAAEAVAPAGSATAAPTATPDEVSRKVVVTIGGHVALPANADEQKAVENPEGEAEAATEGQPAAGGAAASGPTRRRGARILGRIELKPKVVVQRPRPPGTEPVEFDPLDPTRPANRRPGAPAGPPKRGAAASAETEAQRKAKSKDAGKPSGYEWVFDPDDNSSLAALRIGHLSGQRRPSTRRPPVRRSVGGGMRKSRRPADAPTHAISVHAPIGVRDLSELLGLKAREILMQFPGTFDPRDKNAMLDADQLLELAVKLEREITVEPAQTAWDRLMLSENQRTRELAGELLPRPPVVAVMGHVDHGKTSLLDALRKTRVAAGEAGGITQRTSAYLVRTASGAAVTFLDTPGHKAFTEMRARGARLTDVAVLVVAADDGPMEQTLEAIDHAKAAGVPMLVAINKVDKSNADVRMVRQKLASSGVMVEDWGGEVGVVECSATTGKGLQELVERLALETEILELRADPNVPARGVVVDSRKDSKLGIVATVVVRNGTLRAKDALIAGSAVGRVRYMLDDQDRRLEEAGPSVPVQVLGFETPPEAGSEVVAVEDIDEARAVVRERAEAARAKLAVPAAVDAVTMENLYTTIAAQKVTEINVMIKADAHGTLDVLRRTVEELTHPEVRFKVIRAAVGGVTEDDVLLASASKALIIGFAVTADANARQALARTGVEVKYYEVIYEMTDDLEKALEGELAPDRVETVTGHATIREVFKISRYGSIAGCYVTDGTINRESRVRLSRDGKVLWTGRLESLKRFKDDVKEVKENYECGLHLAGYDDIRKDDVLEAFEVSEVKRTLASPALPSA